MMSPPGFRRLTVCTMLALILFVTGSASTGASASAVPPGTPAALPACRDAVRLDQNARMQMLTADCLTDQAITVDDGWTFDGQDHTVHVADPPDGRFRGGVIEVRGGTGMVRAVAIDGALLTPGCSPETAVAGVLFLEAAGEIANTTIERIARGQGYRCGYGIVVAGVGPDIVSVTGNAIAQPGDGGIFVTGAAAHVTGNTITGSGGNGIAFGSPGASGAIAGNNIVDAGYAGISVEEAATATIIGNDVIDSAQFGVIALTGATVTIEDQNRIVGGVAGVVASDPETRVTVDDTEIERPAKDGIYVQNGAEAMVENSTIADCGGSGITFSQSQTRGTIRHNQIERAAVSGILVRDQAEADVIDNELRGPDTRSADGLFGPFGIRFASGTGGKVEENTVSGYLSSKPGSVACGIAIDLDAGDVRLGENVFPEPGNTSNVCIGTLPEGWIIPREPASPVATPES